MSSWFNLIVSNIGSFTLGVLVMRWLTRRAAQAIAHTISEGHPMTDSSPQHIHDTRQEKAAASWRTAAVFFIIGLLCFGLGVRVGFVLLEGKADCFNDYANSLADSLEPRQKASEKLQAADRKVKQTDKAFKRAVAAALTPTADVADFQAVRRTAQRSREATAESLKAQRTLAAERADSPYPEAPREVCR